MNPTTPPIPRDAALGLLLAFGAGWLVGGPVLAGQAFACAGLAVLNLAAYRWLVERTTSDLADGGDGGLSGSLLAGKLIATVAVVSLVLQVVQPVALVLGFATVLVLAAASGAVHSLAAEASA